MRHMSPDQFATIQRELDYSDRELADALGLAGRGYQRVRGIKEGRIEVTGVMALAMLALQAGIRPPWWHHD